MKNIISIEVSTHSSFPDTEGERVMSEIKDLGFTSVKKVRSTKIYKFEGLKKLQDLKLIRDKLLIEPIWLEEPDSNYHDAHVALEIALKPGVTNTEIESIIKAVTDLKVGVLAGRSSRKYYLFGKPTAKEISLIRDKLLMNQTIERVTEKEDSTFILSGIRHKTETIPISGMSRKKLQKISEQRMLVLNIEEMLTVQNYFRKLNRNPTDCELEIIAQTWSEHNCHKTFKADLIIDGKKKKSFMERIRNATDKIRHPDVLVSFKDNAGIVSFDRKFAVCGKTETHNSPSAIEPFGGAMTGSGGVFRDIAGTGLGAKNIASTDIFCFAHPDMSREKIPDGCLHSKTLLQKCVAGVRVYGNCMGIPTVNGSFHFHDDYRAKPVVLVGAYGVIPKKYIHKQKINIGDLIINIGGKTGRDGIHGATFSSAEMSSDTHNTASSAVQIGNPIEELRMFDALLEARNKNLIKSITDCGGGGYSSAIGEIAEVLGAKIDLSRVPLKYSGLSPWEIWLSESQERMIVVIDRVNFKKLSEICRKYNTKIYPIGYFSGSKRLELFYGSEMVADLKMQFLHHGLPKKVLAGKKRKNLSGISQKNYNDHNNYSAILKKVLSDLNVASKEEIVRRYDHEVQGRLMLKPYLGENFDGPADGAIIKPIFSSRKGLAIGHGLNPDIASVDPYWGGIHAVDEAVRNLMAIGTNPGKIFLLDNFIFPKPDQHVLGDLDQAVDGITKISRIYKMPFISGKDSLSGTFRDKNHIINVPPTICISAMGIVDDIQESISSDFKNEQNLIILIGKGEKGLGGTIYAKVEKLAGLNIPKFNLQKTYVLYQKLFLAIKKKLIISCHDISEGGLVTALSEMCFGGNLGAEINISTNDAAEFLFSENGGRFLLEIKPADIKTVTQMLGKSDYQIIGKVSPQKRLIIKNNARLILNNSIDELKSVWQAPFKRYF